MNILLNILKKKNYSQIYVFIFLHVEFDLESSTCSMMHFRDEDKKLISAKIIDEIDKWMERFDCLVIGPGLGRDPFLLVQF